jgi:hypothetical protein
MFRTIKYKYFEFLNLFQKYSENLAFLIPLNYQKDHFKPIGIL